MSKKSFFWASYADLMTSLFFIMLTLFVLTIVMLKRQSEATETELNKIREIQNAVSNIDSTYFEYNEKHKKHILKIDVSFQTGSADISNINDSVLVQLKNAGKTIQSFILKTYEKYAGVQYLLIIEGQASLDPGEEQASFALASITVKNLIGATRHHPAKGGQGHYLSYHLSHILYQCFLFINQFHLVYPKGTAFPPDEVITVLASRRHDDDIFGRTIRRTIFQGYLNLLIARGRLSADELAIGDDITVVLVEDLPDRGLGTDLVRFRLIREGDIYLARVRTAPKVFQTAHILPDTIDRGRGIFILELEGGRE